MDIQQHELDSKAIERELNQDFRSKNSLNFDIEQFKTNAKNLEEQLFKSDLKYKERCDDFKKDILEHSRLNSELKDKNVYLEKELLLVNKKLQEVKDKNSAEVNSFNKIISNLTEKTEQESNEKNTLKKDNENNKRSYEKLKLEYKEVSEKIKIINENHSEELKKKDEKYSNLDKKNEILKEENKNLVLQLEQIKSTANSLTAIESVVDDDKLIQISQLQNDNTSLKNEMKELNTKLINFNKMQNQNELSKKEIGNLKQNIKNLQEMYEGQIKEIQKQTLNTNAEFQSFRRKTTQKASITTDCNITSRGLEILVDYENNVKRLNADINYLKDKIEILNTDIENQKKLRQKDIDFYNGEVRYAEEQAINAKITMASMAYDKDIEIVKFKNLSRKLKQKLFDYKEKLQR